MFSETLRKSYITDFLSFLIINNFKIKTFEVKAIGMKLILFKILQKLEEFTNESEIYW